MSLVASLLKDIVIDGILFSRLREHAETRATGFGLYALAGLFGAAGAVFLMYAGFLALETIYTPLESALCAGGLMITLALITAAGTGIYLKRRKQQRQAGAEQLIRTIETLVEAVEAEISEPIRENPKTAIALAGLTGLFARNFIR